MAGELTLFTFCFPPLLWNFHTSLSVAASKHAHSPELSTTNTLPSATTGEV